MATQCKYHGTTTILDAADSTGAGSAHVTPLQWRTDAHGISWQTVITGGPSAVTVDLEGSLDNTNWTSISEQASANSKLNHAPNPVPNFIRANLTGLDGGTAPTVTVIVQKG